MITGVRGRLISATFAQTELRSLPGATLPPPEFLAALEGWAQRWASAMGPSASLRAMGDAIVIPLLKLLGYEIRGRIDRPLHTVLGAVTGNATTLPVVIVPWSEPLDHTWREAVRDAILADAKWCICCNGPWLRLVDAQHTWARAHVEFNLMLVPRDETASMVFWNVMRCGAMELRPPFLDVAARASARHGVAVCKALGNGVLDALALLLAALRERRSASSRQLLFDQSLTVLYRVLFLLFAEARSLVPIWHPIYRDQYTIGAIVATLLAGRRYRGIWDAILAISRLAHAGCRAGELKVTAFNGRLFAPAHSTAFDQRRIADEIMG